MAKSKEDSSRYCTGHTKMGGAKRQWNRQSTEEGELPASAQLPGRQWVTGGQMVREGGNAPLARTKEGITTARLCVPLLFAGTPARRTMCTRRRPGVPGAAYLRAQLAGGHDLVEANAQQHQHEARPVAGKEMRRGCGGRWVGGRQLAACREKSEMQPCKAPDHRRRSTKSCTWHKHIWRRRTRR